MKSKIIKLVLIFAIALAIFSNYNVQAMEDTLGNPAHYKPGSVGEEIALTDMAGTILGVINAVGVVLSVIILMIIGIKYMVGSVEEKAEYKKAMVPYLTGAILLFGVTTIANMLYNISIGAFSIK